MIAHVRGTLISKDLDRVEIMTAGGVGYELSIPLSAFESLPRVGDEAALHTELVVRDDGWLLFGFGTVFEKRVFQRLLTANGVGPALALGMLSALSAERVVRAIREKDLATLQGVPRVGRKKAERMVLDLADKLDDVAADADGRRRPGDGTGKDLGAEDAVRALVSLGYTPTDADRAVRSSLDDGVRGSETTDLVRAALGKITGRDGSSRK